MIFGKHRETVRRAMAVAADKLKNDPELAEQLRVRVQQAARRALNGHAPPPEPVPCKCAAPHAAGTPCPT